jgi:two-component system OmpR family response regulator
MNATTHLLVIDDDPEIRELLKDYLERNGYQVTTGEDGRAMWRAVEHQNIDLIVLDIMLPGDDGLVLTRQLRAISPVPVILLTALGEDTERIIGLEMGADDYLPKPFNPRELLARIRGVLRRAGSGGVADGDTVRFADWLYDRAAMHLISPDGVVINLSSGEHRLLDIFVTHPNRVLNRDQLMDLLQGRDWGPFDRSIDVQVSRLRRHLNDDAREAALIKTIRGEGYMFTAKVSRVHA